MAQRNHPNKSLLKRFLNLISCLVLVATAILTLTARPQYFGDAKRTKYAVRREQQEEAALSSATRLFNEGGRLFAMGTSHALEQSVKKLEEALPYWRKGGDRYHEGITLSYIGKVYDALGEKQKALDYYNKTLPILREVRDAPSEAKTLNNIGLIYDSRGERRKALEFYSQALVILGKISNTSAEGITLVNIGLAYDGLGEKQKALGYYQRALGLLRAAKDRGSEGVTLNNIGNTYDSLGDKQKALDYFGQALPIFTAIGEARLVAVTLSNIGYVYDSLDEKQKALDFYGRALPVLRSAGDRFKEAVTTNNIGLVNYSVGRFRAALDYFTQALKLRQAIGDRAGTAVTLGDTGMVLVALGESRKALDYYNESLRLSRLVEDQVVESSTLRRIALLEEKRGNLAEARANMEAALLIVESLRKGITSQELRASYFATVHKHFETYISILMHMHRMDPSKGYDGLALRASERARARGMLEMLSEASADIRKGVAPTLLERERFLQQRLSEAAEKQRRFASEIRTPTQIAASKTESENLLVEYQQVEAAIRTASPGYAALTQPNPLSVGEIQKQALDPDTMLLEYSLGEEKSFLWAVTPDSLKSFELPPRAEIEAAARLVYKLLTARNQQIKFETAREKTQRVNQSDKEYAQAAIRLSHMLLGPVAAQLGTNRLLIVGDGVLDYVPFAALSSENNQPVDKFRPLILDHEVVALPSASTLALQRSEMIGRTPAEKTLAVVADPVFDKDDPRVKHIAYDKRSETRTAHGTFDTRSGDNQPNIFSFTQSPGSQQDGTRIQRLPFTRLEADQILALIPQAEGKRAVDFDANRDLATGVELGKYRYVHFATHGILDSQNPELSGIVLSLVNRNGDDQDGFLWAHEIFNLHLPVEMVVLSGCSTGLGKEIRGEGLVGLTRGFMYAGARRVVVSLWDISDEASAELMAQFYRSMLGGEHLSPAAALRSAQITVSKDQRWQAPYYWAAFVLQGEAK